MTDIFAFDSGDGTLVYRDTGAFNRILEDFLASLYATGRGQDG
jgi:hypothetical protein